MRLQQLREMRASLTKQSWLSNKIEKPTSDLQGCLTRGAPSAQSVCSRHPRERSHPQSSAVFLCTLPSGRSRSRVYPTTLPIKVDHTIFHLMLQKGERVPKSFLAFTPPSKQALIAPTARAAHLIAGSGAAGHPQGQAPLHATKAWQCNRQHSMGFLTETPSTSKYLPSSVFAYGDFVRP